MPLLTFGHGRLSRDELAELLRGAGIERVVDVRRFPGSRANEAAAKGHIPELLGTIGIDYRWDERLGGRRTLPRDVDSPDTWWRVEAFRAYAAWTRSDDFQGALPQLVADIQSVRTAVMCSEAVWWRCHRRLIADVVALGCDLPAEHLMHTGKLSLHEPSAGARVASGTELVWDRA